MRLVVIRFSALGDIVLTIPVLRAVREQFPDLEITMVSRPYVQSLFKNTGIAFHSADLTGKHKGIMGLYRLFRELHKKYKPDLVIDLHNVLRSRILAAYFKTSSASVFTIDKGRAAKKALTRQKNKVLKPLKHTSERYADVFRKAGFDVVFNAGSKPGLFRDHAVPEPDFLSEGKKGIGIAPMAKHMGKIWPLKKMHELITLLAESGYQIVLFGSKDESAEMEKLATHGNIINIAGVFTFDKELEIMHHLNVMVSMDSSNMHLAALSGTPVVSIWGATHSFAGFGPLGQEESLKVEISTDELRCRPCSVFGNKPCLRGDYACMNWITPAMVKEKIDFALLNK